MLKKITEPQAQYQKSGSSDGKLNMFSSSPVPNKKMPGKKVNWKIVGSILVVAIVAIVGVAGVLIAQRQSQVAGPVAPNAPASKPSAKIPESDICSLGFEVAKPVAPGNAKCVSKTAVKIISAPQSSPLPADSLVSRGDTIEYTIAFSTQGLKEGDKVKISDTLPPQLTYVGGKAKLDGVITPVQVSGNNISLTVNLGPTSLNKQIKLSYQTKVKTDAANITFTNAAIITTNDDAASADNSCKLTLQVYVTPPTPPKAPTGLAQCESKVAYNTKTNKKYTTSTTNPSGVKRGDVIEYRINVAAEKTTVGPVVVKDTLPPELEYIPNSSSWKDTVPPTATSNVLTFNMGVMAQTGVKQNVQIKYKARVKADADLGKFDNQVSIINGTNAPSVSRSCRASLNVLPEGIAQCTEKTVLNAAGTVLADKAEVQKGDVLTYRIKVGADQPTAGAVKLTDVLPASVSFLSAVTEGVTQTTNGITMDLGTMGTPSDLSRTVEFKVTVKDTATAGDIVNQASVTTAAANANSCEATVRLEYACNVKCETDEQCSSIGSGYICSTDNGNTCRLADNPSSITCQGENPSYSCNSSCENDTQCQTANSNYTCATTTEGKRCRLKDYEAQTSCEATSTPTPSPTPTPTPTIGCNVLCSTNADCSNPDHICSTTADGSNRCRLDEYPSASNCVVPGTPVASTQPNLPEELPVTGPEDWINWLKAGLVTLGIGAVLLLLL